MGVPSRARLASASASAKSPVDRALSRHALAPLREKARELVGEDEAFRWRGDRLGDGVQIVESQPGLHRLQHARLAGQCEPAPATLEGIGAIGLVMGDTLMRRCEFGAKRLARGIRCIMRDARLRQPFRIERTHALAGIDRLIHGGLGEARFVDFVMAVAAIADEVDQDIAMEAGAVIGSEARGAPHRIRVVAVHVDDRRLDHLRDVGAVARRAPLAGGGGEAELVVDDHVDGASDAIGVEPRHLHQLRDDALAGEARIRVDQKRQHGLDTQPRLFRPGAPERHAADHFEMRGMRRERDMQAAPADLPRAAMAEMIGGCHRPDRAMSAGARRPLPRRAAAGAACRRRVRSEPAARDACPPITASLMPWSRLTARMVSSATIKLSPPSMPKRFAVEKRFRHEALESLHPRQDRQDVLLRRSVRRGRRLRTLE